MRFKEIILKFHPLCAAKVELLASEFEYVRIEKGTILIQKGEVYITSGIEEIEAVSPMGIRVKTDSIESLPRGLWIVKGKKIVVTK